MGRLTKETRDAIIRIKSQVCKRPGYRSEFGSKAVYDAVLDHGVRTADEWDRWYEKSDAP